VTHTGTADAAEAAVRAALSTHDATRALAGSRLEAVRGGLSNHAWRAWEDGRSWFVRLGGPESEPLGVDRRSEQALLAVAGAAGLAPPVRMCDPSNGLLVTQFIEGAPWSREDAHQARNVERIVERLRVLHGLAPSTAIHRVDFAAQARTLEAQLHAISVRRDRDPAECDSVSGAIGTARAPGPAIRLIAGAAFAMLASRRPRLTICHNDLHHLNLLDEGNRLWIVDWEYGGVGDPLFDLASVACQHEYTEAERAVLLGAYGAGGALPPPLLDAACTAFDYVQWLWYSLWAARNQDAAVEYASRAASLARRLTAAGP
jgi:thiamine kinase-like enzyme